MGKVMGCALSNVRKPVNMSKTKVKRSAAKNVSANAEAHTNKSKMISKSSGKIAPSTPSPAVAANGDAQLQANSIKTKSGLDLTEKIRELLTLAKEQGHLTYDDINDALPDSVVTPEDLDQIHAKLANLEVEIVDQAEVDRVKQPEAEEEEEKGRLDILDDPVRMYLRQMGKVPLLTRE